MAGALVGSVAIVAVAASVTLIHTGEVQADMQRALDSAVLSAARAEEKAYENPTPLVQDFLQNYIADAKIPVKNLDLAARYAHDRTSISGDLSFDVKTAFPFAGALTAALRRKVVSEVTIPQKPRVEIAFALDMSGSMQSQLPGEGRSRMEGLQIALTRLFDVIEAHRDSAQVMVSLTPYASSVNIGHLESAAAEAAVSSRLTERAKADGAPLTPAQLVPPEPHGPEPHAFFKPPVGAATLDDALMTYYSIVMPPPNLSQPYPVTEHEKSYWRFIATRTADQQNHSPEMLLAPHLWRGAWATERKAALLGRDLPPEAGQKPPFVTALGMATLNASVYANARGEMHKEFATPVQPVLPLTDDFDQLRAYARHFIPYGGTGGHLGMEWAWNTISPSWAGVWAVQPTNANGVFRRVESATPYQRIRPVLDRIKADPEAAHRKRVNQLLAEMGGPSPPGSQSYVTGDRLPALYDDSRTRKLIILMTDGQFSRPVNPDAGLTAAHAYAYFQRICEGARAAGVAIHTIAFTDDAKDHAPLQQCAGGKENFSVVNDTRQLEDAFTRIFSQTIYVSR